VVGVSGACGVQLSVRQRSTPTPTRTHHHRRSRAGGTCAFSVFTWIVVVLFTCVFFAFAMSMWVRGGFAVLVRWLAGVGERMRRRRVRRSRCTTQQQTLIELAAEGERSLLTARTLVHLLRHAARLCVVVHVLLLSVFFPLELFHLCVVMYR
jgi:hypothetical protein